MSSATTTTATVARVRPAVDVGTGSIKRQRRVGMALRLLVIAVALVYALFPVVWIISAALNPTGSMATQSLIPEIASCKNFGTLLNDPLFPFGLWVWNSTKIALATSLLATLITALSAYPFSRFRFRGRRGLLLAILLIQVFPNMLAMVAIFLMLRQFGDYFPVLGLNSYGGLLLVYLGTQMGVNIWLMKGFFDSVPRDIDESALVDGASHWQTFWYLIFPLVRPVLAVVAVLVFIGTYNEFFWATVLLQSDEQFTVMKGLFMFVSAEFGQKWGVFSAGALLGMLPIVAIYLLLQDQIVGGLTQGAVKG